MLCAIQKLLLLFIADVLLLQREDIQRVVLEEVVLKLIGSEELQLERLFPSKSGDTLLFLFLYCYHFIKI